jgi:hypothetical protein
MKEIFKKPFIPYKDFKEKKEFNKLEHLLLQTYKRFSDQGTVEISTRERNLFKDEFIVHKRIYLVNRHPHILDKLRKYPTEKRYLALLFNKRVGNDKATHLVISDNNQYREDERILVFREKDPKPVLAEKCFKIGVNRYEGKAMELSQKEQIQLLKEVNDGKTVVDTDVTYKRIAQLNILSPQFKTDITLKKN